MLVPAVIYRTERRNIPDFCLMIRNKKGDFKLHSSKWVSFGGLGVLKWDNPINNTDKYTYSAENAADRKMLVIPCRLNTL